MIPGTFLGINWSRSSGSTNGQDEDIARNLYGRKYTMNLDKDISKCNCKILDRALDRACSSGSWDQEDYDAMWELVERAKSKCNEHKVNWGLNAL
jgi:hypothetical protein